VRRVRFVGNGGLFSGQNHLQLRGPLETRQSPSLTFTFPFTYFLTPSQLSLGTLATDARRVEVWYAHHGWLDARFDGWELRRVRDRDATRAGVLDLFGHVTPGPRSTLRHLDVTGDLKTAGTTLRTAVNTSAAEVGAPFDLEVMHALRVSMLERLQDATYAHADVQMAIDAHPADRAVDVRYEVLLGQRARFGELRIEGLSRVDEAVVRSSLGFRPGQPFQLSRLRKARQSLFQTGLFSLVDLEPDLSMPDDPAVPIRVRLTEARLRRLRLGVGLTYDYFNLGPRVVAQFRDLRLFDTGVKLEADAGVGAIVGVVRDDEGASGGLLLTGLGSLTLEYPWLRSGKLALRGGASFRQDAQFGTLPFWRLRAEVGLRYAITPAFSLSAGPVFEFFRYLEPSEETLLAARLQFGGDFTGAEYRLLAIDARLRADYRDDPIRTSRGTFWALDVRQSIPIPSPLPGGDSAPGFLYTRAEGEVRGWIQPRFKTLQKRFPLVLGGRLHAIALVPWDLDAALPYPDLAFLGGPTSLRGFRTQQVGPYDALCSYPTGRPDPQHANGRPYEVTRTYLPKGGALGLEAMVEARYDVRYGVGVAVFGDVGMLSRRYVDVPTAGARGGAGVGLRYDSPVGPIRLDVGLRPVFSEDLAPASYIGCNPIDRLPRGFDVLTGGVVAREDLARRTFPLAINVSLAIGEAF